jgi:hypothetical protein
MRRRPNMSTPIHPYTGINLDLLNATVERVATELDEATPPTERRQDEN